MNSIKMFAAFIGELLSKRAIIIELAKNDFKSAYLGSYLGLMWAFLLPLANIFTFWLVFQIGFRSRPVADVPFILWYIPGMIIWTFFSDTVSKGMGAVSQNSFIVKKVVFSIGMLPIIKILSSMAIHLLFIFIALSMYAAYKMSITIYVIQTVYYLFAASVLVLGISWITSSIIVFFKDLSQIISIILQFGFFLTPIFWPPEILPTKYYNIIRLNPVYYLVQGYRDSFINKVWFWEHWDLTLYYWGVTAGIFIAGAVVFRRLRPHFADVL